MAGLAIDLQELPVNIDKLDATDPTDRQLQVGYNLAAGIGSMLRAIAAPGSGKFLMPTHVIEADRATYEATINNAISANVDLLAALKSSVSLT